MSARSSFEQNGQVSGVERPLRDAAAADQAAIGARRDHREVRLPAAERAVAVVPRRQIDALHAAPRRSARETAAAPAPAPDRGSAGASSGVALRAGRAPSTPEVASYHCVDERLERVAVASERDDLLRGRRARARRSGAGCRRSGAASAGNRVHRAGCRRSGRAGRPAACCARSHARVGLNPRQRHARLHAALHLDQRELHVDGGRQLGLRDLQLLELDDFARLGARWRGGRSVTWRLYGSWSARERRTSADAGRDA